MERSQTVTNALLFLEIVGFTIALEGVVQYFSDRYYFENLYRKLLLLYLHLVHGLDRDPARPDIPESWEDWYNS